MTLHDAILKLKQDSSGYAQSPYLLYWDLAVCQTIDNEASKDDFLRESHSEIMAHLTDCSLDYNVRFKRAYDVYAMAKFYMKFRSQLSMRKVPEVKDQKTPDFESRLNNEVFYWEMKTLGFVDEDNNVKDVLRAGLDGQVDLESQVKAGKGFAFVEQSIQPFGQSAVEGVKKNVEILIRKISGLIKREQFRLGDTLMVVDLSLLDVLPWANGMRPAYADQNDVVSGVLWNVAFGEIGHQIYKAPEFEGKSNIDGVLSMNGILIDFPFVKGICFLVGTFGGNEKMLGLFRIADGAIGELLRVSCSFYNNEKNCMPNKLF